METSYLGGRHPRRAPLAFFVLLVLHRPPLKTSLVPGPCWQGVQGGSWSSGGTRRNFRTCALGTHSATGRPTTQKTRNGNRGGGWKSSGPGDSVQGEAGTWKMKRISMGERGALQAGSTAGAQLEGLEVW